jgi:tetratricopeptide (TPR) repeat protein
MADSSADHLKTLFSTAVSYHQRGEGEKARRLYEQIIQQDPAHADALHLLGLVAAQEGNYRIAVEWMDKAIAIDSANPGFHSNRGLALYELGDMDGAIESFKKAIQSDPGFAQAHNNQGLALQALSRLDEALASFDRAIALFEDYAEAHYNKGLVLQKLQRFEEAVECYRRALQRAPDYADAHYNKGLAQKALGRFNDAIASFRACLAISPDAAEAHFNLGVVLQKINQPDAAIASYDRVISIDPGFAQAHNNRGLIFKDLKQWNEAIDSYDRAITVEPAFFEAYGNRGVVLLKLNQLQQAIENFNKAIAIEPGYADAYNSRGFALQAMGELDAAIEDYDRALQLKPDFAMAKLNKALVLLLKGDWAEGWVLYESGSAAGKRAGVRKLLCEWDGQPIQGSLLVLPEQGVGDEIFYSGMLNDLQGLAASITVGVDPRLMPLYQRSFDHLNVVSSKELPDMQSYDAQIHMASLGRHFRADADAFKRIRSPYLKADPQRIGRLRAQIAGEGKLICGLSWVSKNKDLGADKSLRLQDLNPILQLPGLTFVDLQYGDTAAERTLVRESMGIEIGHVDEVDNFNDLDGLAALIEACDVVVTVSNTTAHLAGALGKKVMIMVPCSFGLLWYWHVDRSDSPWYPSAKLFRQTVVGDWGYVVEAVRDELQNSCLQ